MNSSTTSSRVRSDEPAGSRASTRYALWLVVAIVLPNLLATVAFWLEPGIFYFRAWEYLGDVVYQVDGAPREWRGRESGDLSRKSLLSSQESWPTQVSVDALGFRSVPIAAEQYRVAVTGDSNIFGSGLSDDETLPWLLAERLGVPVFNASRTSLPNALLHPALRDVELVLDLRGESQLLDWFQPLEPEREFEPLRDPRGSLLSVVPPERYLPAPWLMRAGSRLARDLLGVNRRGTGPDGWLYSADVHRPEDLDTIVQAVRARADALRNRGIDYAFVAIPKKQTVYATELGLTLDDYTVGFTATLARALRERGIQSIDLAPVLREAKRAAPVYFKTDTHWTPHGVRAAAEALVRDLELEERLARGRATAAPPAVPAPVPTPSQNREVAHHADH